MGGTMVESLMENLDDVLDCKEKWKLKWYEPWEGKDFEGNSVTCAVTAIASVQDCINIQRKSYFAKMNRLNESLSDRILLADFITIHYATFIKETE
jgi:hypothetical protein